MKFTREMVDDYAEKLLIGLTEEENKMSNKGKRIQIVL